MKITLLRSEFSDISTIGELLIDDTFFCYTLEDVDRGLFNDMPADEIKLKKIPHETAIPYGTYWVTITDSMRFKRKMPLVTNVKGFEGIRIHSGNTDIDTDGCILLGKTKGVNFIGQSKIAFDEFFALLQEVGDSWLEIKKKDFAKRISV